MVIEALESLYYSAIAALFDGSMDKTQYTKLESQNVTK
jgi:hypothetical protein